MIGAALPGSGEQTGSGVQSDPARARQVGLAPRVQVGEIDLGARRPVERFHVRLQLDEIAGDEARRDAQVAQQLDQQPAGIAAGAACAGKRLLRRLDARRHADEVADVLRQPHVQRDQEIHRRRWHARHRIEEALEARRERAAQQVGCKLVQLALVVAEREFFGVRLEKEVEGVDH